MAYRQPGLFGLFGLLGLLGLAGARRGPLGRMRRRMHSPFEVAGLSLGLCLAGVSSLLAAGAQTPAGSVWDGVYTAEQANRGRIQYETTCVRCHSADLSGADARPLSGDEFMRVWRGVAVASLVELAGRMPPGESGVLGDAAYVDIISYVLQSNGFPPGNEELTLERLGDDGIVIEGADGPQPAENFSLVQIVGCLTRGPDGVWLVTDASEPLRMRDPDRRPVRRSSEPRPGHSATGPSR